MRRVEYFVVSLVVTVLKFWRQNDFSPKSRFSSENTFILIDGSNFIGKLIPSSSSRGTSLNFNY